MAKRPTLENDGKPLPLPEKTMTIISPQEMRDMIDSVLIYLRIGEVSVKRAIQLTADKCRRSYGAVRVVVFSKIATNYRRDDKGHQVSVVPSKYLSRTRKPKYYEAEFIRMFAKKGKYSVPMLADIFHLHRNNIRIVLGITKGKRS